MHRGIVRLRLLRCRIAAAAAGPSTLPRGRRVFRRTLSSRVPSTGDDSEYFRLAISRLRRQNQTDVDLEALQAAVACCHSREQLSDLLTAATVSSGSTPPSPLEGRLLLLACARFGALREATVVVERTLQGGCSDSDAQVLLQGLVRMCSTVEELAATAELGPTGTRSRLPASSSGAAFEALLWAALSADAAPLAARVVEAWVTRAGTVAPVAAWLEEHVVRVATEVRAALELQQQKRQQQQDEGRSGLRGRASAFLKGLLPPGAVSGVSGAVLARVRAGQHVLLAPDGSLRDAAVAALARLSETELEHMASSVPPARRLQAVRILAPVHAHLLLRDSSFSRGRRGALLAHHAKFLACMCGETEAPLPSPWAVDGDSALALTQRDVESGATAPAALVAALQDRRSLCAAGRARPLNVAQGCGALKALLSCPRGPGCSANVDSCCAAFLAIVRSRPTAFAADAEVGLLLLAVAAPTGSAPAVGAGVEEALRVAAASAAAVSDAGIGSALGSTVGDVSLELLLQRSNGALQSATRACHPEWWLSPLIARFPPLFDAALPPPSYLRELSREGGSRVDWFDDIGHDTPGEDVDAVMLIRSRLRTGGAFLTGYFAEGVEALATRPDNVFSLASAFDFEQGGEESVVDAWAAAGPAAIACLQASAAFAVKSGETCPSTVALALHRSRSFPAGLCVTLAVPASAGRRAGRDGARIALHC